MARRGARGSRPRLGAGQVVNAIDELAHLLDHATRHDAMLGIEVELLLAATRGLVDGTLHGAGDLVGVQDGLAFQVAGRAPDGLDQAALGAQEALLVGIQNGHQRHLGNVQPLAQQVDAHQHIEDAQSQVTDDLDTLDRVDVGMQVAHPHLVIGQEVGEILGHALGERGDQYPMPPGHPGRDLGEHVVDLGGGRPHLHLGVDQAGGTHHLLDHLAGVGGLIVGRRGRDKDALAHLRLEFLEGERPVVQRRGQPEAILHQRVLAGAVATVHAAQLADGDVALVDEHQRIGRQVIDERGRRLAGPRARQVPRVVLDALAEAQLLQHLQIEERTLLQALRLDQLALGMEERQPVLQLGLDGVECAHDGGTRRDVVRGRIDDEARDLLADAPGERVEELQHLHLVVEHLDAQRQLGVLGREHVDGVAAHAEGAAREVGVVALVLHGHQLLEQVALCETVALAQHQPHLEVVGRVADTVDARDAADDDGVTPLQQRLGGRQAQLLDVLVDGGILLDEEITLRHIGFRLIVVVVRDEVLDSIFRKEVAHLGVELRRQGLVGCQHQRRPPQPGDDVGHGVGLARARHAQQRLERKAVLHALDQRVDGAGLIACGRKGLMQPVGTAGIGDDPRTGRSGCGR